MFFETNLEQRTHALAKKMEDLVAQVEEVDQKIEELLSELQVSSEQLTAFLKEKENFTEENWMQLSEKKKEINAKLERELGQICNPAKLKQTYKSLRIQPHWLFVR